MYYNKSQCKEKTFSNVKIEKVFNELLTKGALYVKKWDYTASAAIENSFNLSLKSAGQFSETSI